VGKDKAVQNLFEFLLVYNKRTLISHSRQRWQS